MDRRIIYVLSLAILLCASVAWGRMGVLTLGSTPAITGASTYSDSFTNSNDTALATHNSAWASASASYVVSNLEIIGNAVTTTSTYAVGGAYHQTSTSDTSQIVFKGLSNTSQSVNKYVGVRMDGSSLGYNAGMISLSAGNWTAIAIRENTTQLSTTCTGLSIAADADHTLKIVASGTTTVTISVYVDGSGTATCEKTDSSATITSGHPGFYVGGNGTIGNNAFDSWQDY